MSKYPFLIEPSNVASPERLLDLIPEYEIIACDFYINGAENGRDVPGGYQMGRILNVDHHAPTQRMAKRVSSTNLALAELTESAHGGARVVINHTDCDSVLSAALMCGLLDPDPRYGAAAIAADHTGEENHIADLLQSLEPLRDFEFSLRSLATFEQGRPLDSTALDLVSHRIAQRLKAREFVSYGAFDRRGCITYASLPERLDSTFLPSLLPDACVILLFLPIGMPGRHEAKLRLGPAAPPGLTLHHLQIREFDPNFGGRWNAGADGRSGGTALSIDAYATALEQRLTHALSELNERSK